MRATSDRGGPGRWKERLLRRKEAFLALWRQEYGQARERAGQLAEVVKHRKEHRPDRGRLRELMYHRLAVQELSVVFLGLCPLAWMVSSTPRALMLGILITLTLFCANGLIAVLTTILPGSVGPVCRVVVIAGFIAAFEIVMQLIFPTQSRELGSYIPLAAISCISLDLALNTTRAEGVPYLLADALFTGLSLTVILLCIGLVREVLGCWTLFGFPLPGGWKPLSVLTEPAGGFLTLGAVTALMQALRGGGERRRSK